MWGEGEMAKHQHWRGSQAKNVRKAPPVLVFARLFGGHQRGGRLAFPIQRAAAG
jgi:hypothetical protein